MENNSLDKSKAYKGPTECEILAKVERTVVMSEYVGFFLTKHSESNEVRNWRSWPAKKSEDNIKTTEFTLFPGLEKPIVPATQTAESKTKEDF